MGYTSSLFVLGLLTLFLLTGGGNCQGGGGILDRGNDDLRLLVNALRLIKLEEKLEAVKEKLEGAKKAETEDKIYGDLASRVSRLEGTGCRDNEIQCGGGAQECISELLVCDGVKDCHNGHDEDAKYCDVSEINAGMTFSGWFTFGKCMRGGRKSYFCRSTITNVRRSKLFPSHLYMTSEGSCNWEEQHENPFLGITKFVIPSHYQNANRRWTEYGYGYVNDCYFPEDNFNELHCKSMLGATTCHQHIIAYRDKEQ